MDIPRVVYLQFFDENGDENSEPTWSRERIHNTDVEYIQMKEIISIIEET